MIGGPYVATPSAEIAARRSGTARRIPPRSGTFAARGHSGSGCARRTRSHWESGTGGRAAVRRTGSSGRQIEQVGSVPIQYSGLTRSIRLPISLPISSVTAGGRNGLGLPSQPCVAPETAGSATWVTIASASACGESKRYRPLPTRNSARSARTVRLTRTNMPCMLWRSVTTHRCSPPTV